jgi:hypothetical protein
MPHPRIAPYGSWKSPITSELIVGQTIALGAPLLDGRDVYWCEGRPLEGGCVAVVRRTPDGAIRDITSPPFNVRSRVHEYGGGAYMVHQGTVYFSSFTDNRVYALTSGTEPRPITVGGTYRYADFALDGRRNRLICVREDHSTGSEPENTLVGVALAGRAGRGKVLASGYDFYSSPRVSPDGTRLAWLSWRHPNMPCGTRRSSGSPRLARTAGW